MNASRPVAWSVDDDGVGWIIFDDPAARANVLNPATQEALEAALDAMCNAAQIARGGGARLRAIVVTSGKDRIFIAGADLKQLAALPDATTASDFARRGQRLLQRLADLPVPVVCAIHGACAGGGFELALACHWRIASDASVTQIGLPETSLGTIPGWGGCVRLARLLGAKPALEHILNGRLVSAADALRAELVHEVVPGGELRERAKRAALKLAQEGRPVRPPPVAVPREILAELRATTVQGGGKHNPALLAAIDAVAGGAELRVAEALEAEAKYFGAVTAGGVCKNLIHVFFLRETAKKRTLEGWFDAAGPAPEAIRRVGVVGAGVMGSGIAQWCASRGIEVVMRDVEAEALERGMTVVRGLFDEAVKRGKMSAGEANSALQRVTPTRGWDGFQTCDLVVEAIVEDAAAKRALFGELAGVVAADALLASNTSALPIEEIAGQVTRPERTIGIHFFNPVSRMPLVELVLGKATSAETAARALALVKALGKSPVICRSSPGFVVTRVLFFYLNAAVREWEQGVELAELDAALKEFGWPMGPLRLIDEVGVDVTEFIFGEMEHYFGARFGRTSTCARLVAAGLRGRKNGPGRGFYRYEGKVEAGNEEEVRAVAAPLAHARSCGRERVDLVEKLMRVMVDEAQRCLDEGVAKSADEVDFALLSGAGFPAFRGGLMRWARAEGWVG